MLSYFLNACHDVYICFVLEIRSVSMGQGQEIHARNMISDCIANGGWVLLQNMHLSLPFCTEAMDALSDSEEIHSTFRMWITTEVHPQFPIALLQVNYFYTIIYNTFN